MQSVFITTLYMYMCNYLSPDNCVPTMETIEIGHIVYCYVYT